MDNPRKKKILYIITKANFGGAQRYVFDLATNMSTDKYEVVVALGEGGVLDKKLIEKNVRVLKLDKLSRDPSVFDIGIFFTLIKIMHKEMPDIVHLNSSKIGGIGALAARIHNLYISALTLFKTQNPGCKSKIIFTAHGWPFYEERPLIETSIIKILSYLTVLLCHKVIAVSSKDACAISPLFSKRISLVHNGVANIMTTDKQSAQKFLAGIIKIKYYNRKIWFGSISELTPNKGLKYAIRALKHLRFLDPKLFSKLIFVIIGEGEEKNELQNMVSKFNLSDQVFFAGYIEDARNYLRAFDIFSLTSVKEGLPYVILEAGLAENCVVASHTGGIPDIIEDMKDGVLVTRKRAEDFAKIWLHLLRNKEKIDEFGKALNAKVVANFSLEKMLESTVKIYEN